LLGHMQYVAHNIMTKFTSYSSSGTVEMNIASRSLHRLRNNEQRLELSPEHVLQQRLNIVRKYNRMALIKKTFTFHMFLSLVR
jgi:hypothetical protein